MASSSKLPLPLTTGLPVPEFKPATSPVQKVLHTTLTFSFLV